MKMFKLKPWVLTGMTLFLLLSGAVTHAEPYMSEIIKGEVNKVDVPGRSVVINGKQYKVAIDSAASSYSSKLNQTYLLNLRDLKSGQAYYFEVAAKGRDMQNSNYTDVIFIANQLPTE